MRENPPATRRASCIRRRLAARLPDAGRHCIWDGRSSTAPRCTGPVAQRLEPTAHNGLVGGSNPPGPTNAFKELGGGNAGMTSITSLPSSASSGRFRNSCLIRSNVMLPALECAPGTVLPQSVFIGRGRRRRARKLNQSYKSRWRSPRSTPQSGRGGRFWPRLARESSNPSRLLPSLGPRARGREKGRPPALPSNRRLAKHTRRSAPQG